MPALGPLLGESFLAAFVARHYARSWVHRPGAALALIDVCTFDDVNDLVLLALGTNDIATADGGVPTDLIPAEAAAVLAGGATVIIRNAERHHAGIARLVNELALETGERSTAYVYVSQPGRPGLAQHYDPGDSVMVQLAGSKRWALTERTETAPRTGSQGAAGPGHVDAEITMNPGDSLYLPAGTWHAPVASTESLHLNLKIHARPSLDFLTWLRDEAATDPVWQHPRPLSLSPDPKPVAAHYDGLIEWLAAKLSDPDLIPRYLRTRASVEPSRDVAHYPLTAQDDQT